MSKSLVLGVDIGGSHITSAVIDVWAGSILRESYVRKPVNSHREAAYIISTWAEAIQESFSSLTTPPSNIGMAIPGPMDYPKGICFIQGQDKFENLYGLNIKELLAAELDISPDLIMLQNDACCFLQGEILGSLEAQYGRIMGFTLGTGLGSACFSDNIVFDADLWRMPFRQSIAEDYLSTRWFTKRYQELTSKTVTNVEEMLSKLEHEPLIKSIFGEFGDNLGCFLNECIVLHNPQAIVLGGNIARSADLFLHKTNETLARAGNSLPLYGARLGEESALVGAAGIWKRQMLSAGSVRPQ